VAHAADNNAASLSEVDVNNDNIESHSIKNELVTEESESIEETSVSCSSEERMDDIEDINI